MVECVPARGSRMSRGALVSLWVDFRGASPCPWPAVTHALTFFFRRCFFLFCSFCHTLRSAQTAGCFCTRVSDVSHDLAPVWLFRSCRGVGQLGRTQLSRCGGGRRASPPLDTKAQTAASQPHKLPSLVLRGARADSPRLWRAIWRAIWRGSCETRITPLTAKKQKEKK